MDRVRQSAPDLMPHMEKMRPMVCELSKADVDGDAFRYAATKGDVEHSGMPRQVNLDAFQSWFDENRVYVNDALFLIGFELDEMDIGGATKFYKRHELVDLADRLPQRTAWNKQILEDFHRQEMEAKPELSWRQFQMALSNIQSKAWLSIRLGVEIPLSEVSSDLFERLTLERGASISPVEWGALYWIYKVGVGVDPEDYFSGMALARETAARFEKLQEQEHIRRSTMSAAELEVDDYKRFDDGGRTFDCSGMGCYSSEGMIRDNLPSRAYIICRGLDRLGQPTLLYAFQRACDFAGIGWAVPSSKGKGRLF